MSALRFLFALLLVLNLLALAAIRGWLGPPQGDRGEPERLTNQLKPGLIQLRPPTAVAQPRSAPPPAAPRPAGPSDVPESAPEAAPAPESTEEAAAPPERACVSVGALTAAQADGVVEAIDDPELAVARSTTSTPSAWWVRIPPAANREAAERKMSELRGVGVSDLFLIQESGPNRYAISLGLFKGEAAARQHLAELRAMGVRGAELATRNGTVHRLEITGPATALARLASDLAITLPTAEQGECSP